ncbi:MAG: NADH-quinone oxidoreductase subunit NuoN [Halothiobacillaceae bacterium]|jgi:NADH-quinone oxidoreductase subunit N|nr:NADH-quinone oxidoreductase subunit NuoN [Halothiobacillaceae bacterium]
MTLDSLNLLPILPEIVLAAMACFILVLDPFLPDSRRDISYGLAQASLLLALFFSLMGADDVVRLSFNGMVVNDAMGDVMKAFVLIVSLAVFLLARGYLKARGLYKGEFFMLGLFGVLGMLIMISSNHLLLIFLGLELMSLSMYAMVALDRDNARASEAAMKYFVLGALASGLLLYGMSLLYGMTGSLYLADIGQNLSTNGSESPVLAVALVFILVGLTFKLGAAPFHMWLPDVYDGAPTAVTLYLAAAPKIAGVAIVLRLLVEGMGAMLSDWQPMLIVLAVISLFVGNVIAIAQTSFKRMLTYSTISHVGFILLGILAGTYEGYSAALFYTVAYAIMTIGGFGIIVYLASKGHEADQLDDLKGLNDRSPLMAFVFLVIMFSMAGIPFTLGFWAKLAVLQAVVQVEMVTLAVYAVVMSVIGAFYYLRAVKMAYFDAPLNPSAPVQALDLRTVMVGTGLIVLVLGLYPSALVSYCAAAFGLN